MPEISPHNGNDLHSSTGCLPDSKTCAACGDTSHILLPLADLLKAVASTLQNQTPHNHDQDPELSGIDFEKQSINDGAKQLNESLLRNHVTSHWKNHVQSRLWRSFEPKTEPASEAVHKKENQKTPIDNGEAAASTAQAAVPASNDAPGDGSESDQKDSDCKIQPEMMDRECSPTEAVAKDQEQGTAEPK